MTKLEAIDNDAVPAYVRERKKKTDLFRDLRNGVCKYESAQFRASIDVVVIQLRSNRSFNS